MFPDDDRVVALFAEARRKFGDDILRDPRRSVPLLADQAPELRDTIKAVADAIGVGAAQRLRVAGDQGAEFHRLAAEVAGRAGVALPDAMAGVRIAARLGGAPAGPAAAAAPQERSWVGGSTVAGGPAPGGQGYGAPGQGAPGYGAPGYGAGATPQEFMKGKWGVAALVGVGILVVVGLSTGNEKPAPQQPQAPQAPQAPQGGDPPPGRPPQGGPPPGGRAPPQSAGLPIIVPPGGNQQVPAIGVRESQQAYVLEFGASAGNQIYRVIVGVSKQGWGAGFVAVASQGANEPESVSKASPFQLTNQNNNAIRVLQPQWERDGLNIGAMCVAFVQSGARDVQLRGSNVCVLADNCNQMIGCGMVQ
ncbi:hypothetical protein [Vineibacter terrae]|uniref:hypothetical protein n=1 Tax=Vineibacter terrae TaxID=2586908 RepID=UPI0015B62ABE|nr:hypothetical protein [Vineibacter terrae]